MMTLTGTIIIFCWIILGLYWTVSAFFQKPTSKRSGDISKIVYGLLTLIPAILLIKYDIYSPFSLVLVRQSLFVDISSVSLCILGLFFTVWARIVLAGNWSEKVVLKENHELIDNGPYYYIRHPIYSGLLIMYLGTALAVGRLGSLVGFIILGIGFWFKLRHEEVLLTKHFGKKYIEYSKKTKALVPYLI